MNIEERLEALTHSVELLGGMQIETEKRMARLAETMEVLAAGQERIHLQMATLVDGMELLTHIALDHTRRIEKIEGK
jgi:hypothetical protein